MQAQLPSYKILQKASPLVIRGIGSNKYIITEYINLSIYVSERYTKNQFVEVLLRYIVFVVDNLKAKMLIEMNILVSEDIDLIISTRIDYVDSYSTTFELTITSPARLFIKQEILFELLISISARFYLVISVESIVLSIDNDFLFESTKNCSVVLFIVVIDSSFYAMLVCNNSD